MLLIKNKDGHLEHPRTLQETLAQNPAQMFFVRYADGVLSAQGLEAYLSDHLYYSVNNGDGTTTPVAPRVYTAIPEQLHMSAVDLLSYAECDWVDSVAYPDWHLRTTPELVNELQAVLDKIVAHGGEHNISYQPGEAVDISDLWARVVSKGCEKESAHAQV